MRWKTCPCQHWPIYLANGQLTSKLHTIQISVNSTGIYPYFGRKINGNRSQSWDKILMLQIIQRFVLYPAIMLANHYLDRLANASKCTFSTLLLISFATCAMSLLLGTLFNTKLSTELYSYLSTIAIIHEIVHHTCLKRVTVD